MNRSWVGKMRKTVGCHLHKGGDWVKGRRWECWEG